MTVRTQGSQDDSRCKARHFTVATFPFLHRIEGKTTRKFTGSSHGGSDYVVSETGSKSVLNCKLNEFGALVNT